MKTKQKIARYFWVLLISLSTITLGCSKEDFVLEDGDNGKEPEPIPAPDAPESETPVGPALLKINAGGPTVTVGADTFEADKFFVGAGETYVMETPADIKGTTQDDIYVTERVAIQNKGEFGYAIPVSNGTYTVKLYFAEIFWGVEGTKGALGGVGSRVFDVDLEGDNTMNNYDIFKQVGALTAHTRMFDVTVSDGVLNIDVDSRVDRPKISAFVIFGNGEIRQ